MAACATNPVTGERQFSFMSEAQEISIGQESHIQIEQAMGFYGDLELQRYIEGIGLEMARRSERPDLPWHFTVVARILAYGSILVVTAAATAPYLLARLRRNEEHVMPADPVADDDLAP